MPQSALQGQGMITLLLLQVVAEVAFLAQQPKQLSEFCATLHSAALAALPGTPPDLAQADKIPITLIWIQKQHAQAC